MEPYIKFTYFHDPITPRTVTVARLLEGELMYIDWAVNRMNRASVAYAHHNYEPVWEGDLFVKSLAREITRGRVLKRRNVVTINEERSKMDQVIDYMLDPDNTPQFVRDIVSRSCSARAAKRTGAYAKSMSIFVTAEHLTESE